MAFVNDGMACLGLGPSEGIDWTYGPGGITIRCDSSSESFSNAMVSPPLALPASWDQYDGAHLEYDVYLHKITNNSGPFDYFQIRSSLDGGANWSNLVYITGGIMTGSTEVQVGGKVIGPAQNTVTV